VDAWFAHSLLSVSFPVRIPVLIVIALLATVPVSVHAQGSARGGRFVAFRAGANLVGNTYRVRERRPEPGAGGSVGTYLSPVWALEFETWVRASNPAACCEARRHETLYSLSVVRLLTTGGLQPYMVGGLSWLNAAESEMQVQVGVGALFPLRGRVAMALDLRGNGGGATMIVRPTAALIYYLR
jgi:hypothetical protein